VNAVSASYDGGSRQGQAVERRLYVRVPFLKPVRVWAPPEDRPVEARTLDISLGGVGITCRAAFRKGQVVIIGFRLTDPRLGTVEERVTGRVANLQADDDSNRVGIEFSEPIHPSVFPALARAVGRL
jgi:c-di-GMP-binding flagellar brake protein YcgR